jgi:hypothetical protein
MMHSPDSSELVASSASAAVSKQSQWLTSDDQPWASKRKLTPDAIGGFGRGWDTWLGSTSRGTLVPFGRSLAVVVITVGHTASGFGWRTRDAVGALSWRCRRWYLGRDRRLGRRGCRNSSRGGTFPCAIYYPTADGFGRSRTK